MNSRDEILGRLRPLARNTSHPQHWQSRRDFADLAVRFTEVVNGRFGLRSGEDNVVQSKCQMLDSVERSANKRP